MSMEERLRWRECHHENVTVKTEKYEAEKKRMFEQREADFQRRRAISDNRGDLRKELNGLRDTNRQMNEELRTRKWTYEKQKKEREARDWKAGINAASTLAASSPKMRSNLSSSWPLSPASMSKSFSTPSLSMSRSVPTHMASPMSSSLREGTTNRLYASWYRHG